MAPVSRPTTQGHDSKLYNEVIKYDLWKYLSTERIVDLWIHLPYTCVVKSQSVDSFKKNLD